jgi:hypothetical protein
VRLKYVPDNAVGTVKCLLSLGADPGINGKWGKVKGTAMDFARHKRHDEIVAILEEYENLSEYGEYAKHKKTRISTCWALAESTDEDDADGDEIVEQDLPALSQALRRVERERDELKDRLHLKEKELRAIHKKLLSHVTKEDSRTDVSRKRWTRDMMTSLFLFDRIVRQPRATCA